MPYRIGVDIGGTFTDFALFDEAKRAMTIHKRLTTPADPSTAVLEGIATLLGDHRVAVSDVDAVVHGTTLVTNAVIERRGAATGMLATEGFMDIPDMRLELRYDMFDLRLKYPPPVVPRYMRAEVSERISYEGDVQTPLDIDDARAAIQGLIDAHGIEALAVCFLHSYLDARHEDAVKELCIREFPDLHVSTSSEVFPQMREYERWTTAMINAYTQPMFDRYLRRLEKGLDELGITGRFYMMTSNGGTVTPDIARRFPVRMMESGPAAGALMSAHHGRLLEIPDVLSFDMGGTTAKGALVRGHAPLKKYEMEVARVHEFKKGSGLLVKVPVIDMIEIGAGGGSIAEADDRGLIRVGPRSAGADPGPACYGRGGTQATLTDANVVLGYLDPDFFLGGEMHLDRAAAEYAITEHVAEPLGLTLTRAAWGIHEIIDEDVARAFCIHASERGFDYRGCSMVAFGGSGPVHAAGVARKLRIRRVVFPLAAGVMSALGLLVSPLSFEVLRSNLVFLDDLNDDWVERYLRLPVDEACGYLIGAGVPESDIEVTLRLDMRYHGQGYEIEVTLPTDAGPGLAGVADLRPRLQEMFEARYAEVFSEVLLEESLEVMNWKVEATGPETAAAEGYGISGAGEGGSSASGKASAGTARKGTRPAYFPEAGDFVEATVYDRMALAPGTGISGPALIEERESTCVIGSADTARIDAHHNLIVDLAAGPTETPAEAGEAVSA
ncbi:MAG: hydantoinase/oxoprolinase family protein [Rhodospirillaceae bacterium]|nr:hydantoinase/oxoprolinase family protein [Rhodospirillaceae bacterium]